MLFLELFSPAPQYKISGELLALKTQPPTHTPNVTAPHVGNGTLGVPFYPSACQGIEINKYFFFEICTTAVEFNSLIDCNHKSRKKIPIKTQYQYDTVCPHPQNSLFFNSSMNTRQKKSLTISKLSLPPVSNAFYLRKMLLKAAETLFDSIPVWGKPPLISQYW